MLQDRSRQASPSRRSCCGSCGYLTAFVVTRNKWRDEMIRRGVARYKLADRQMGMGRASERIEDVGSAVRRSGSCKRGEAAGVFAQGLTKETIWERVC